VKRRDLLRAAGAATALSFLPRNAEAAWSRVLAGYRAADGLTPAQRALVTGIADTIIPRTDMPSASDVGVIDWVDLLVAEYYSETDWTPFLAGLDAIDAQTRSARGRRQDGAKSERSRGGRHRAGFQKQRNPLF